MKWWNATKRSGTHVGPRKDWERPVERWVDWLEVTGRSAQTIRTRWYQLCQFSREVDKSIPDVTEDDLVVCLSRLGDESRRGMRSCVAVFYDWCVRGGLAATNPAAGIPAIRVRLPQGMICPEEAVVRGLGSPDEDTRIAVMLGAFCGLRRIEMTRIRKSDLRETPGGMIVMIHGKGNKNRVLPVPAVLASALDERPDGWLFPGSVDGHCGVDYVAKRIKKATGYPSHALRRRFATVAYYRSGCNILLVSRLLGHENVATTMRYIGLVNSDARNAVEAAVRTDPGLVASPVRITRAIGG